jgi:outer membrane protein assembly factor BamD (BamD/ComL family)
MRLAKLPGAPDLIGQRVLEWAKGHPADPDVPEALYLTVRATRYGNAKTVQNPDNTSYSPTSKAAFQLLHRNYPKSEWAAKTPYYY